MPRSLIPPPEDVAPEVSGDLYDLHSDFYYVFQAEDGTIRRARIGSSPFGRGKKPAGVPARVHDFHYWVVDVCRATGDAR